MTNSTVHFVCNMTAEPLRLDEPADHHRHQVHEPLLSTFIARAVGVELLWHAARILDCVRRCFGTAVRDFSVAAQNYRRAPGCDRRTHWRASPKAHFRPGARDQRAVPARVIATYRFAADRDGTARRRRCAP